MSKSQFYVNSDIKYLINKDIRELDIQRAGLQALREMGIIDEETYKYWKSRDKKWSAVYIGKHLSKNMVKQNELIGLAVDKFIIENKIENSNIISRKRDALFTFNVNPKVMNVDGYQFISKHKYTSYYFLGKCGKNALEMYYNSRTDDLKILGVSDEYYKDHPFIPYLKSCIRWYELLDNGFSSYSDVYSKIHQLRNDYCNFKLPVGCYREIAIENPLCLYDGERKEYMYSLQVPSLDKERYKLTANYNFTHFIVPFINILPSLRSKEILNNRGRQNKNWGKTYYDWRK